MNQKTIYLTKSVSLTLPNIEYILNQPLSEQSFSKALNRIINQHKTMKNLIKTKNNKLIEIQEEENQYIKNTHYNAKSQQ